MASLIIRVQLMRHLQHVQVSMPAIKITCIFTG